MAVLLVMLSLCGSGPVVAAPVGDGSAAAAGGDPTPGAASPSGSLAVGPGKPLLVTHESALLGITQSFYVLLPAGYDPSKRYPVLYVLHGASGSHRDWIRLTDIESYARPYEMILVFPDGGAYGWYLDSPLDPRFRYESYIVDELIPYVDEHFATDPSRSARGIVGLSMGGHGAITLAFKHPERFTSASSLSGVLDITRHRWEWELAKRLGPYVENTERWQQHSALYLAASVSPSSGIQLLIDCGTSDFAITENRAFHARLQELAIPHAYVERPGQHNWAYWDAHIAEHLAFHARAFGLSGP